jgi:hypothetical protein
MITKRLLPELKPRLPTMPISLPEDPKAAARQVIALAARDKLMPFSPACRALKVANNHATRGARWGISSSAPSLQHQAGHGQQVWNGGVGCPLAQLGGMQPRRIGQGIPEPGGQDHVFVIRHGGSPEVQSLQARAWSAACTVDLGRRNLLRRLDNSVDVPESGHSVQALLVLLRRVTARRLLREHAANAGPNGGTPTEYKNALP